MLSYLGWVAYLFFGYYIFRAVCHTVFHAYVYFYAPMKDLKKLAKTDWAAVTGATDGIGKQYAIQLAKQGMNLVLISRTQSKLDDVREEILKLNPNIKIETIAFDFTDTSPESYEKILRQPMKKVGFLVNNVGGVYEIPDRLHEVKGGLAEQKQVVDLNLIPAFCLCSIVLKYMKERGGGTIVNVGSIAGSVTFVYVSAYGATKTALEKFSHILRVEYPEVYIQHLTPGWIVTKFSKKMKPTFFDLTAEEYVKYAVKTVGWVNDTRGHYAQQLQFDIITSLPMWLQDFLMEKSLKAKREENVEFIRLRELQENNNVAKNGKLE
ncbi:unnamed protein product [Bursaphelenchus xylophilus]|uniref:(pine wood nematode) hypothetical protein n=1 Tax=Bursaphelenchus xylophilus TaxID=6326 RepID=A0A1I7RPA9_BURXY|nr:unnamed protein product [Bursaphelenchus xylophilus]CAG9095707.1 unnamed protein product [Bursaphelenchus xylophilus]